MKKILFMVLLLAAMVMAVGPDTIHQRPNEKWWSDSTTNPLYRWVQEADKYINLGSLPGTGDIYYVDSGCTTAGNGNTWDTALATLDEAIAKCTDNNGDVILVAPGHSETFSTDAATDQDSVDVDVAGVTIIGCGTGTDIPKFIYADVDNEFVIGAANVTIYNLQFVSSITNVTHCIDIENAGDYARVIHCYFPDGEAAGTDEFIDTIQVGTTATDVTISGCNYFSTGTGSNNFVDLSAATIANPTVTYNIIYGAFAEAGIWAGAAVPTNCNIAWNVVTNTTSGQFAIEFQGAATGVCIGNKMYTDAEATSLDPGSLMCIENYVTTVIDKSAVLIPAPDPQSQDILGKLVANADGTGVYPATLATDSIMAMVMCKGAAATASTYDNTTDSLEALSDAIAVISTDTAAMDTATELQALAGTNAMERSISKTVSTIANGANNLFAVAGGPIKITEIVAYVTTTAIGAESCKISYLVDPTTPAGDTAFGTDGDPLEINADAVGTLYTWDGVLAADLVATTNGCLLAAGTDVSYGLIVPVGMVELTAVHDGACTGEITVYMTYIPLSASTTVTAQ